MFEERVHDRDSNCIVPSSPWNFVSQNLSWTLWCAVCNCSRSLSTCTSASRTLTQTLSSCRRWRGASSLRLSSLSGEAVAVWSLPTSVHTCSFIFSIDLAVNEGRQTHTHKHTHTHTHRCRHTKHTHTHTHTQHTHVHTYTDSQTHMHTHFSYTHFGQIWLEVSRIHSLTKTH